MPIWYIFIHLSHNRAYKYCYTLAVHCRASWIDEFVVQTGIEGEVLSILCSYFRIYNDKNI